jgi:hypothetical protein
MLACRLVGELNGADYLVIKEGPHEFNPDSSGSDKQFAVFRSPAIVAG